MTVTAVEITSRPTPVGTRPAGKAQEPAGVIIVANVETLADTNVARCNDDNPYR